MNNIMEIINQIRSFNRFYTNILGLIDQNILESEYSLTEVRILFEIQELGYCTAINLSSRLFIDKSYMSRIIGKFEKNGIITKKTSFEDNRLNFISLTIKGVETINELIKRSNKQISEILEPLEMKEYEKICEAMETIKKYFTKATSSIIIRTFTNEDLDFIISNQIKLYEVEYGLTTDKWKTYVKDGVEQLVRQFDSDKDCMYILENNGQPLGCIAITHMDILTAQLRFFFIDSSLRGLGAGNLLIDKAIAFCREANYKKIYLWTFSTLGAARHLYKKKGFKIIETHKNSEWGTPVLEECWGLEL